jgi:hypothetical protein
LGNTAVVTYTIHIDDSFSLPISGTGSINVAPGENIVAVSNRNNVTYTFGIYYNVETKTLYTYVKGFRGSEVKGILVKEDTTTYVLSTASLNECIDETNFISAFFTSSSKFIKNTVTQSNVVVTKTVYVDTTTTTTTIISNNTTTIRPLVIPAPFIDTYVPAAKGVNVLRGATAYTSSFLT